MIIPVRTFRSTRMELCAQWSHRLGAWFVYDRHMGEIAWHMHCGPYSTRAQAVDWIMAIQEV